MVFSSLSDNFPILAVVLAVAYYVGVYLLLMADEREPAEQFAWLFGAAPFPLIPGN